MKEFFKASPQEVEVFVDSLLPERQSSYVIGRTFFEVVNRSTFYWNSLSLPDRRILAELPPDQAAGVGYLRPSERRSQNQDGIAGLSFSWNTRLQTVFKKGFCGDTPVLYAWDSGWVNIDLNMNGESFRFSPKLLVNGQGRVYPDNEVWLFTEVYPRIARYARRLSLKREPKIVTEEEFYNGRKYRDK